MAGRVTQQGGAAPWDGGAVVWTSGEQAQAHGRGVLRGELVSLRPLQDDDVALLERWWNDPENAALQQRVVRPQPAASFTDIVRGWSANATGSGVGFTVVDLGDTSVAGHATLFGASMPGRCAKLAIMIGPEHVGRGLGTDAVRVLTGYGFQEMGLHRIELTVWSFNQRARRAYAAAGFIEEGRRRDAVFHGGAWYDEVLMARLETDDASLP